MSARRDRYLRSIDILGGADGAAPTAPQATTQATAQAAAPPVGAAEPSAGPPSDLPTSELPVAPSDDEIAEAVASTDVADAIDVDAFSTAIDDALADEGVLTEALDEALNAMPVEDEAPTDDSAAEDSAEADGGADGSDGSVDPAVPESPPVPPESPPEPPAPPVPAKHRIANASIAAKARATQPRIVTPRGAPTSIQRGNVTPGAQRLRGEDAPTDAATPAAKPSRLLASPFPALASDEAWTKFVVALRVAGFGDVSPSNALGAFELTPRRLADLGILTDLRRTRAKSGRMVWIGRFVPPMTAKAFLSDPKEQYKALADSMRDYVARMRSGDVPVPEGGRPEDMTLSGALAILHRRGPAGLRVWTDVDGRFSDTERAYNATNGIF